MVVAVSADQPSEALPRVATARVALHFPGPGRQVDLEQHVWSEERDGQGGLCPRRLAG